MARIGLRRFVLGSLGATLAATLVACGVESDSPTDNPNWHTPMPAGDPSASADAARRASAVAGAEKAIADSPESVFADSRHAFVARDVVLDPDGSEHVRFDRTFLGMKVIGGDFVVHRDPRGKVSSVSQVISNKIDLDPTPSIDAATAKASAVASLTDVADKNVVSATLVVDVSQDSAAAALAYEVVVAGTRTLPEHGETDTEMHVFVDAKVGSIIDQWDGIETVQATGSGNGFFVGNVPLTTDQTGPATFMLRDPSRGNTYTIDLKGQKSGTTVFSDADNAWGDGTLANAQSVGVDAQFGTSETWDYYKEIHGRNGIANNGAGAYNRVHYGKNYNNAYWSDSCFCMTYGDGDGTTFNPFDSLDVAGHEMSHGVTSRSANLAYRGESGGLNEATSDIFGTAVEFYANNANDTPDYDIGEKLYKSGTKSLRYMTQPSKDGNSADCWYSMIKRLDVHYSSGPANHFFYLLSEGSAPNAYAPAGSKTCVAGDTRVASGSAVVAGIGRAAAEKIWYRALTVYMTSSTNYAGARTASLNAAADLYGAGSAEYAGVASAWTAVGVQ